jgi:hypothetical protein
LDPTKFLQTVMQRRQKPGIVILGIRKQDAYFSGLLALLRRCHERPSHRASKPRNELPPFHSITSSAIASTCGGMERPSALTVLRLMTNSNLVAWITGRSPAFRL